jgi:hypothetical protein
MTNYTNPEGVETILFDALDDFGVDASTNNLYFRGKKVIVENTYKLRSYELILATVVAASTLALFLIELLRYLKICTGLDCT